MKSNIRILMLNYEFPPLGGGAANANYYLLKELAKEKDLVIDLVTSSVGKFKKEKFSQNITLHRLDIGKDKNNLHYQTNKDLLVYSLKAYFYSKKLVKKNNYDLVHAWFGIPNGFIALLLGKPYIVALRGSDVPFYNTRFKVFDKLFFQHLSKLVWERAKVVTANSQGLKELAQKIAPKQKIEVVYNGVDTNFFKPDSPVAKKNIILFVGRLIERKGVNYLLEAFSQINFKKRESWQIWLVGEGPEKDNLESLAKRLKIVPQVKFLGRKSKEGLVKIYNQAKIFVLPSLNEGMSNTILEAMACGLPIITTSVGGSKELIKNNGLIVKPKSGKELMQAIKEYIDSSDLLKRHGQESGKMAKKMSWGKAAKEYKAVYKKYEKN
jgi:L-malate glycosyltransferase